MLADSIGTMYRPGALGDYTNARWYTYGLPVQGGDTYEVVGCLVYGRREQNEGDQMRDEVRCGTGVPTHTHTVEAYVLNVA